MNIGDIVRHMPSGDLVSSVLQPEPEFEAGIIIKKQDVKAGDIVRLFPGEPDMGLYLWIDPGLPDRSMVLWDFDIYSVPTFQLEVVSDEVIGECR
jgi:hypothetical protein